MSVAVLRPADFREMAWRNGRGRTLELAIEPAEADLESFEWRVSMATVGSSGAFSKFPGCDRVIVLLDGKGFTIGNRVVDRPLEPVRFDGDEEIDCRLIDGPVRDFNVITRRTRARAEVTVVRGGCEAAGPLTLVYVVEGRAEVAGVEVVAGELAKLRGRGRIGGSTVIAIRIDPA
jgi:hypothetical protein